MHSRRVQIGQKPSGADEGVFDADRALENKAFYSACYAPSVSMYFDQMGDVRACCQNSGGKLGSIRRQTIREIWQSADAARLRDALAERDFSVGCGFCQWQVDEGGTSPFARSFDAMAIPEEQLLWPKQMEFSMSNVCNLQCVMCNGDWSSSIRAHREHRPALPAVYGPEFFEELAEFLPHLERVVFLGGEPFLGKEPLNVMEMLLDMSLSVPVSITTNATQWSAKIERICSDLPMSIVVSLDGITKGTFESIRVGANFDQVMGNISQFLKVVNPQTGSVSLAHCLMRPNYHEFIDLLRFAEDAGMTSVGINSVVYPRHLSLYQMDESDLREVVRNLELQDAGPAQQLGGLKHVWDEQLAALQNHLDSLQQNTARAVDPWFAVHPPDTPLVDELTLWTEGGDPFLVSCENSWRLSEGQEIARPITAVDQRFADLVGLEDSQILGQPMSFILDALRRAYGDEYRVELVVGEHGSNVAVHFTTSDGVRWQVRVIFVEDGENIRVVIGYRSMEERPPEPAKSRPQL